MAAETGRPGGDADARIAALEAELARLRAELGTGRDGLIPSAPHDDLATAALEASEGRYRAIVDSATDHAIITTDLQSRMTGWNEGAHAVLGWREDEVMGRNAAVIFTPENRAACAPEHEIATARDQGRAADERWHQRQDGSRFWASGELMRLLGAGGAHVGQNLTSSATARPPVTPKRGWLRLPPAERRASDGLNDELVRALEKAKTRRNETNPVAAPLAARLGLERLWSVDDHSADTPGSTDPAEQKAYADAIGRAWDNPARRCGGRWRRERPRSAPWATSRCSPAR